jgi:hypothetical protein
MSASSFLRRGSMASSFSLANPLCIPVRLASISQSASKIDIPHSLTRISSRKSGVIALDWKFRHGIASLAGEKDADHA